MQKELITPNDIEVIVSTSSDRYHDIYNMLDGKNETFWMSTGLFPQEFILKFKKAMEPDKVAIIKQIRIFGSHIKGCIMESTTSSTPMNFQKIMDENTFSDNKVKRLQSETFNVTEVKAKYLKIIITSGHNDFVSIHRLNCKGYIV